MGRPALNGCVRFDTKSNAYAVRTVEKRQTSMSILGNKAGETTNRGNARASSIRTVCHIIPCVLLGKERVSILEQLLHGMRYEISEGLDLVQSGTIMFQIPKRPAVITVRPLHKTPPTDSIDQQCFGRLHNNFLLPPDAGGGSAEDGAVLGYAVHTPLRFRLENLEAMSKTLDGGGDLSSLRAHSQQTREVCMM